MMDENRCWFVILSPFIGVGETTPHILFVKMAFIGNRYPLATHKRVFAILEVFLLRCPSQ